MRRVRVVLNSRGVRQFLRSGPVRADMERRARNVASATGIAGMESSGHTGSNRARASVITTDYESREAEATTRSLTSAIDAGRH